jgi:diguanylate cyclase (GGDEF)-like protein
MAVLIDCDDFKMVNEVWGHGAGDFVLKEVVRRLCMIIRGCDRLARVGGNELLLVLPDTGREEAIRLAQRMRDSVGKPPILWNGKSIEQHVSLGVFDVPPRTTSITELFATGSKILARSKTDGKNSVAAVTGAQANMGDGTGDMDRDLEAWNQPIIRLANRATVAYEFFTRSPRDAHAWPETLFTYAQDHGALASLDFEAFATCARAVAFEAPRRAHIDLYWSTLEHHSLDELLGVFSHNAPSTSLRLEFAVASISSPVDKHKVTRDALRRAGVRMALDHVDLSARSMERLLVLEPDVVKIDRKLIVLARESPATRNVLGRLIRASLVLGAEVIAMGVETGEELAMLQPAGVQSGQGALWAAPVLVDGTTAWSVDLDRPADEPWLVGTSKPEGHGPKILHV